MDVIHVFVLLCSWPAREELRIKNSGKYSKKYNLLHISIREKQPPTVLSLTAINVEKIL